MAEKTINTRILLKYDTYENWTTNNPVLKQGEVAIAAIATNADGVQNAPSIVVKVGDGTSKYNALKFVSGLAADVYSWAKASVKPTYSAEEITGLSDFISGEIEDTDTQYRITKVDDYNYKLQSKAKGAADTTYVDVSTITIPKYTLPTASATVLGGVKTGSNITNTSGTISITKGNVTDALGFTPADASKTATTSANGLMSSDDKTKLDGVEAGAQKNTITGVKGSAETDYRTGNVNITAANVGLGNVTNESKKTMFTSAALTGTPTAPTAATSTNTTQIATTAFVQSVVNDKIAAADAMIYKGTLGTGGTITALPATHKTGWTYKVITAGTYAGAKCEIGDMIVCLNDGTTAKDGDWTVIQNNIDGAVTGAASSVAGHIATFDGTTGKVIKDSGFTIATSVPANAKFTDTVYVPATTSDDGLMSSADKAKLNGIAEGANKTVVDTAMSATSTNPVQNKVVKSAIDTLDNSLAAIAKTGNVNDLVQTAGDTLIFDCGNSVF